MAAACGKASGCSRMKLSKNLLEMKFMKKSKEKVETEKLHAEEQQLLDHDLAETMKKSGTQFIVEPSFIPFEDLIFGRVSFKGQNPEIEKIMKELALEKQNRATDEKEKRGTISEEEMANRYATLIGTVSNKFSTKRQRHEDDPFTSRPHSKRTKFIKPNDRE